MQPTAPVEAKPSIT